MPRAQLAVDLFVRQNKGGDVLAVKFILRSGTHKYVPFYVALQMAPSQLKQLKNSLREHGLTGPPQSKKQKKRGTKDQEKRLQRNAALHNIRERFNPFEFKASARSTKFEVTTNKPVNGVAAKGLQGRPGVTKGLGEERVGPDVQ